MILGGVTTIILLFLIAIGVIAVFNRGRKRLVSRRSFLLGSTREGSVELQPTECSNENSAPDLESATVLGFAGKKPEIPVRDVQTCEEASLL
jgi:hypothetical protein